VDVRPRKSLCDGVVWIACSTKEMSDLRFVAGGKHLDQEFSERGEVARNDERLEDRRLCGTELGAREV
jgi:hypothetical protein